MAVVNDRHDEPSAGSRIAVIDKAVRVLDAIVASPAGLSPTQVAQAIDTNRSTAFRLLVSLEHAGLLTRDAPGGRYRLGMKMLQYGSAVRLGMSVIEVAEPILLGLRDETRQTTFLALREDWGARCLMRLPGLEVDVASWTTGQWLPLHAAAAPRALRSAMSDGEVDRYLVDTDEWRIDDSRSTADDVRTDVGDIRRDGWVLDTAEVPGLATLATIVRDRTGAAVCAIAVAGLVRHYAAPLLDRSAEAVMTAAGDIGRQLPA